MDAHTEKMCLCSKCVTTSLFVEWVVEHGQLGRCEFDLTHGENTPVVTVRALAEHVDEYLRDRYVLGSEEPYYDDSDHVSCLQRGSSLLEILADEMGSGEPVVEAIIDNLPDASPREISKGAEPFYDSSAMYESIADVKARERAEQEEYWFENRFTYKWQDFCETVQYERRYFNTKELLDDLFGEPAEYQSGSLNPVYNLLVGTRIFRGRILNNSLTSQFLSRAPARELGAPPRDKAPAGRMNVEFIPAFYGAFTEQTAVAELRPGIGEQIAIGEFILQAVVKVFDFTAFSGPLAPDFRDAVFKHTRFDFIRQMEDEISRRVLSYEAQREYIPTQIVAEYLKRFFQCDAVIYKSSVVTGRENDNRNIVFLPRSDSFTEGETPLLGYQRCSTREVRNIVYDLFASPF